MPIVLLTQQEHNVLMDIIDVHLDGLQETKRLAATDLGGEEMLEIVADVDAAIASTIKMKERVQRGR